MNYNQNIHHRRSIRLKGYDYSQAGAYFITICCQEKEVSTFGEIVDGKMILNAYGTIAYNEWGNTPNVRNNRVAISVGANCIRPFYFPNCIRPDMHSWKLIHHDIYSWNSIRQYGYMYLFVL